MPGFPARPGRDALGPTMKDALAVENPEHDIGADIFNLAFWQIGGLSRVSPRAVVAFSVDAGPAVDGVPFQALAWDSEGALSVLVITRTGLGIYAIPFAATYPDENGVQRPTNLFGGFAGNLSATPNIAKVIMTTPSAAEIRLFDMAGGAVDPPAGTNTIVALW